MDAEDLDMKMLMSARSNLNNYHDRGVCWYYQKMIGAGDLGINIINA